MLVTIIFYYWRKACFCEWKKIRGFNDNDVDDNDSLGMHLMKNEWRLTATTLVPRVSISHSLAAHHWLCFKEDEHHLKETSFVSPSPSILWRDEWHHIDRCPHQQNPSVINIYIVNINNHITTSQGKPAFSWLMKKNNQVHEENSYKWQIHYK